METLVRLTFAATIAVVVVVGSLTVRFGAQVDPITDPVSDYALHGSGELWFALAVLLMIASGLAVGAAMKHADVPRGTGPTVCFGLWCAGLALCAVFPGNRSVTDTTLSGEIHRFGGALFLTSLPVACWQLARSLRKSPQWIRLAARIRWLGIVSSGTAAAFGVSQFVLWLPQGLLERFALAAELVLLVVLAVTVRLTVRRAAR